MHGSKILYMQKQYIFCKQNKTIETNFEQSNAFTVVI